MDGKSQAFNVTILSNNSSAQYPDNKLSAFSNKMPINLSLSGEWVVGVSEIYLNKVEIKKCLVKHQVHLGATVYLDRLSEHMKEFEMNSFRFNIIMEEHTAVNKYRFTPYIKERDWTENYIELLISIAMNHPQINDTPPVLNLADFTSKVRELKNHLQPNEFRDNIIKNLIEELSNDITWVQDDWNENYISFLKSIRAAPADYYSPCENQSENKFDFVFLYCDLIKPRIMASQYYQCLKVFPATRNEQIINFRKIEYYPVQLTDFNSISIALLNDLGEKIDYESSINPTMVTLRFKRLK